MKKAIVFSSDICNTMTDDSSIKESESFLKLQKLAFLLNKRKEEKEADIVLCSLMCNASLSYLRGYANRLNYALLTDQQMTSQYYNNGIWVYARNSIVERDFALKESKVIDLYKSLEKEYKIIDFMYASSLLNDFTYDALIRKGKMNPDALTLIKPGAISGEFFDGVEATGIDGIISTLSEKQKIYTLQTNSKS